jgi:hypothetical protein
MGLKLSNNAASFLVGGIDTSSTTLSVMPGQGSFFPVLSEPDDWHPLTVIKANGTLEIMRATARTADTFTVTRAQEGTDANSFSSNDRVELRYTKAVFDDIIAMYDSVPAQVQTSSTIISEAGGTPDEITGSFTPPISSLNNGQLFLIRAAASNATTTPTFTPHVGTIAPKIIVKGSNATLEIGDIAGEAHWLELQYDATLDKWMLLNPAIGLHDGDFVKKSGDTMIADLQFKAGQTDGRIAIDLGGSLGFFSNTLNNWILITNTVNGTVELLNRPTWGINTPWDDGNFDPDTKANVSAFDNHIDVNGFQRLEGGVIIQWGVGGGVEANVSTTHYTFPIAFPSFCLVVNPTVNWDWQNNGIHTGWGLNNVSATGFSITTNFDSKIDSIQWIAIGY